MRPSWGSVRLGVTCGRPPRRVMSACFSAHGFAGAGRRHPRPSGARPAIDAPAPSLRLRCATHSRRMRLRRVVLIKACADGTARAGGSGRERACARVDARLRASGARSARDVPARRLRRPKVARSARGSPASPATDVRTGAVGARRPRRASVHAFARGACAGHARGAAIRVRRARQACHGGTELAMCHRGTGARRGARRVHALTPRGAARWCHHATRRGAGAASSGLRRSCHAVQRDGATASPRRRVFDALPCHAGTR